jgi:hypothetical protein
MSNLNNLIKFFLLFSLFLSTGNAFAWYADGSPDGNVYRVEVFSSFGTQFQDCFSFNKTGQLTVEGYDGQLTYSKDQLNYQPQEWQATSSQEGAGGFDLSFHGTVRGTGHTILANGMNEYGETFILQGVLDSACRAAAKAKARASASPYKK